jgi:PEP-CTERM motif
MMNGLRWSALFFSPKSNSTALSSLRPALVWGGILLTIITFGSPRPVKAAPVTVTYTSTKITGNEWQYDYTLTGTYVAGDDLAVYFPLATSLNLLDLGTGGADWTTFVFQPDPSIPADGEYDMEANVGNPSLAVSFDVQFDYSGIGAPGPQSFVLYDPNFDILNTGETQAPGSAPPVPEPASFVLVGSALLGCSRYIPRRRR